MHKYFLACCTLAYLKPSESISSIACDPIYSSIIRVAWHFKQSDDSQFDCYLVSWYIVEDYLTINPTAESTFRDYVSYDYGSEAYRYSYDRTYLEVLEDNAVSFGLTSFSYEIVKDDRRHLEINNTARSNATFDITVRAFFPDNIKSPILHPALNCTVVMPFIPAEVSTTTHVAPSAADLGSLSPLVIVPGSILLVVCTILGAVLFRRYLQQRHNKAKASITWFPASADDWSCGSRDEELRQPGANHFRHWVVTSAKDCWSPPLLQCDSYVSTGNDMFDQFHLRHSLTTVTEESDEVSSDDLQEARTVQHRPPASTSKENLRTRPTTRAGHSARRMTPQTPRSASSRRRLIGSRSSYLSDLADSALSSSLYWSDDETTDELDDDRRSYASVDYKRKRHRQLARRIRYRNHERFSTALLESSQPLLKQAKERTSTPAVMTSNQHSYASSGLGQRRNLRSTHSKMNVLSL